MSKAILGLSAWYHDSAAALIVDGRIVAAAQEERFTRIRHDQSFPVNAIQFVLEQSGLSCDDVSGVAFYDKSLLKFERLLETYHAFAPVGLRSFLTAMPVWIKDKIAAKRTLRKELAKLGIRNVALFFPEHHLSHAASAFYPSPFEEAAILTIDGVGEWATTTIGKGNSNQISIIKELHFPHSVGMLYSAFTDYLGFKVNSGEYKMMGLAPYGDSLSAQTKGYKAKIVSNLVDIREDGSILLNMDYFNFATGLTMSHAAKWQHLFGVSRRQPETDINQEHMNLALAIQEVTETIVMSLARTARNITGRKNLVMAGGVALNCVANAKIRSAKIFENIWVQPAAGDAGGSLGAALAAWHIGMERERKVELPDGMQGAYLGQEYSDKQIGTVLNMLDANAALFSNTSELISAVAAKLAEGKIIGWFQGRMEFGPRALGNRSILADPRNPEIQKLLNLKIKMREGFRPFAPAVLEEDAGLYFHDGGSSPYMLFVDTLLEQQRTAEPRHRDSSGLFERLYTIRSVVPAVTHVDYTARIQTVSKKTNPLFWQLISEFKRLTGCSMLVNTSFNVRGEPIVCSPKDAYLGFRRTEMDYLVIGNYLMSKADQRKLPERFGVEKYFQPD